VLQLLRRVARADAGIISDTFSSALRPTLICVEDQSRSLAARAQRASPRLCATRARRVLRRSYVTRRTHSGSRRGDAGTHTLDVDVDVISFGSGKQPLSGSAGGEAHELAPRMAAAIRARTDGLHGVDTDAAAIALTPGLSTNAGGVVQAASDTCPRVAPESHGPTSTSARWPRSPSTATWPRPSPRLDCARRATP
jgi:hypothetical protein